MRVVLKVSTVRISYIAYKITLGSSAPRGEAAPNTIKVGFTWSARGHRAL